MLLYLYFCQYYLLSQVFLYYIKDLIKQRKMVLQHFIRKQQSIIFVIFTVLTFSHFYSFARQIYILVKTKVYLRAIWQLGMLYGFERKKMEVEKDESNTNTLYRFQRRRPIYPKQCSLKKSHNKHLHCLQFGNTNFLILFCFLLFFFVFLYF